MEKIAEVLGRKFPQFNTISPDHFISNALHQMCAENVEFLIVLDGERFVGVLSGGDVANKVLFADKPLNEVRVKEFMSRNFPVATLDDSIEYCMQLMEQYNTKYLAVYHNFDFKGILSLHDLMVEALSKRRAVFEEHPAEASSFSQGY